MFCDDGDILISLLPLNTATVLPSIPGPWNPGEGLLQQIQLIPQSATSSNILCKIGTATTNEQFREWVLDKNGGASLWTLPLNVIMVEITFGGSFTPMCHGAGIRNKTLSDLVAEVEYVDPNGNVHTVSDPELLKAAAGSLGLLGVVTAYTIRLDKMTYARMIPLAVPVELAIPPPQEYIDAANKGDQRYKWIKDLVAKHDQATMDKALKDFIQRAENDYYAEWFWFPLQASVWVNAWNNDGLESDAKNIPSDFDAFLEWFEEWIAQCVIDWWAFQLLPGQAQAQIMGFIALHQMPNLSDTDTPSILLRLFY